MTRATSRRDAITISGPAGQLEALLEEPKELSEPKVAVLCHPHPQYQGTMLNKVVHTLARSMNDLGMPAIRFNFRGVGRSQGEYDEGAGELSDAASALDWLQSANPDASQCWVGGFSFGAWICMQLLMRRPEINSFIALAPPANKYDFAFLAPCPASGLIVHGADDNIVPEDSVATFSKKLASQKRITIDYQIIEGANHFFHEKVDELTTRVDAYLEREVAALENAQ